MQLELPDAMASRIEALVNRHPGDTPLDVLGKALSKLEDEQSFETFRGKLKNTTLNEMLADCRQGLI